MGTTYKKILIILAIALVVVLAIVVAFKVYNIHEDKKSATPRDQVVVECRIVSFTEVGILVELSEDSSFATLLVEISNDEWPTRFDVGTYIDVYYNGVIEDANPAKFHTIYNIVRSGDDKTEQKTYSDWNIPNLKIDDLDEEELALITTTIQSYLSVASNTSLISINSLLGTVNSESDIIEAYLCRVQYNGTTVEEWKVIYLLRQENDCGVIKTDALELSHK